MALSWARFWAYRLGVALRCRLLPHIRRTRGKVYAMADREQLHELRQRAHDAGIEGSSKMSEDQLRKALQKVSKGTDPMTAKREAKGWQ